MEEVQRSLGIDWSEDDGTQQEIITEEVIELNNVDDVDEEEYLVGEEIIPSTDVTNSLDHIAAENLIYMAHDGHVVQTMGDLIAEQVEQVENADYNEQQQYFECQVTEEVITDDWVQQQGEERVEIPVDQLCTTGDVQEEDMDVPLPTDQDEYTTSRPYPCDFCSRRFRKKATLMNHMVAHQNDRPHVCNLCGARYIRRCDLLNHLKIHAYIPEGGDLEELEKIQKENTVKLKRKYESKRYKSENRITSKKLKMETIDESSIKYEYVQDIKLLTSDDNDNDGIVESNESFEELQDGEDAYIRYPVTDPKKPFVCQHCGVGFARQKALASHSRIHGGDSPFECETCGEMFWDPAVLRDHQKLQHQGQGMESEYEPENEENEEASESEDSNFGGFFCETCGMSFHRYELLKRHSRQHVKKETNLDGEVAGHCCNVCGESFAEALDLLAHAEVHARSQTLKCMLCGESFIEESAIKSHIRIVHANELTQHSCRLCGKLCRDSRTLTKHSWEHSTEKNHSCSKCGKNFHNKARLKRHMVSHRNKTVTCDMCGEEFPDGRSLMNHRHSHSNVTGRQFPCRECGKTFGSRSSQQIHIRIHTGERPYGCRYCWKAFADGGTLRKHERIHTGEKPYVCSVCPRAFNQRVVLREHIRSHHSSPDTKRGNAATPYYCQVCHELFVTSLDLIQHLIQHSDMNTAMKRQPITGPRKYKRRRKLKPHELAKLRAEKSKLGEIEYTDEEEQYLQDEEDDNFQEEEDEAVSFSKTTRTRNNVSAQQIISPSPISSSYTTTTTDAVIIATSEKKPTKKKNNNNIDVDTLIDHLGAPMDLNVASMTTNATNVTTNNSNAKTTKTTNKKKKSDDNHPSRPKMIHTQKTRVPIEDGKRKTKTLVTWTTQSSANETEHSGGGLKNERNRPRTKNVNYHILVPDKLPNATFSNDLNDMISIKNEDNDKQSSSFQLRYDKDILESDISSFGNLGNHLFELPRNSLTKYNSDIVNDLEEILRSPIKGQNTMLMHHHQQEDYTVSPDGDCGGTTSDDGGEYNHHSSQIIMDQGSTNSMISSRPRRNVKRKFSFKIDSPTSSSAVGSSAGGGSATTKPNKKVSNTKKSVNNNKSSSRNGKQIKSINKRNNNNNNNSLKIKREKVDYSNVVVKSENELIIPDDLYKCDMCSAVFSDRSQLLIHGASIHI